ACRSPAALTHRRSSGSRSGTPASRSWRRPSNGALLNWAPPAAPPGVDRQLLLVYAPGHRTSHRTDTPRVMDAYRPLLIAGLVVTEVAIWQWRMVIAHRGSRVSAMLLGIIGAVLQITAITQVVADVSDPAGVIAYAIGVGFGVLLGLVAGERLTPGMI